jgi:hypothetical protein
VLASYCTGKIARFLFVGYEKIAIFWGYPFDLENIKNYRLGAFSFGLLLNSDYFKILA